MKKFVSLLCMLACILGLTACGSEKQITAYEEQKLEYAKSVAAQTWVPLLSGFMDDASKEVYDEYTPEEIEFIFESNYKLKVEGRSFQGAMESFHSAAKSLGAVTEIGEATAEFDGKTIIVRVPVTGEKKNAEAEIILSNDMFMVLESAALNPISTFSEQMSKAGLNTLLGMGTVFSVLVLISLIIACFGVIPKLQKKFSAKNQTQAATVSAGAAATEQPVEVVDESDDCELVAVIAAAIAAYEGSASTDGFVVRSIHKRKR